MDEILIRHAKSGDYTDLHELYSQPAVIAGTLQLPFPPESLMQSRLEKQPPNSHSLVASIEGKVVGQLFLFTIDRPRRKHVASFGMAVHDAYQGRGIGSRLIEAMIELADNWLNITRIEMDVYTDNGSAVHLYQKFGFEIEGTRRQFAFRNGRYVDAYSMARIREVEGRG